MAASQRPYIAMEYIDGGSLTDCLQELDNKRQRIAVDEALILMRQIASALVVAHGAGIVHRDLKPSNILLRQDGTAVLSDLGIAAVQQASTRLTRTGGVLGSPHYMSPEQGLGQPVDGRSDIYSLGVILYELLSGQLPFNEGSPVAIVHQHVYQDPVPLEQARPGLTAEIYDVAQTCLQKDPANRYQNAGELSAALERAMQAQRPIALGVTTLADTMSVAEPAKDEIKAVPIAAQVSPVKKPKGKVPAWLTTLAIVSILLIIATLVAFWTRNRNVALDSIEAAETALPANFESPAATSTGMLKTLIPTSTVESPTETSESVATATRQPPETSTPQPSPTLQANLESRGCVNDGLNAVIWEEAQVTGGSCDVTFVGFNAGDEVLIIGEQSQFGGGSCGSVPFIHVQSVADPAKDGWMREELIAPLPPGESCSQ